MTGAVELLSVTADNLERVGFFCYKSKRKTAGYSAKLAWMRGRLAEGLRLHMVVEDGVSKGFIEAIPGEHAWRAANAAGYLFIHCLWVVGRAKGKGYGARLLDECLQEAEAGGYRGVAVLSSSRPWLTRPEFFARHGFEQVDSAPPCFSLLARVFGDQARPTLPADWEARQRAFGDDLTAVYTDQCPYLAGVKEAVFSAGRALGIPAQAVKLESAREVQARAPSAYGVYSVIYRGELVSTHPIGSEALLEALRPRAG